MYITFPRIAVDDLQLEVVTGSLLGDGWLQGPDSYNLSFAKKQMTSRKEYLSWHFSALRDLSCSLTDRQQLQKFNYYRVRGVRKVSEVSVFVTHTHPDFTELGRKWYKMEDGVFVKNAHGRRIKVVPHDLVLSPLSLAIWFCDDGTNSVRNRTAIFCTNSFTFDECAFLSDKLRSIFDIKSTVHSQRSRPLIRVSAASYGDFINMIKPHVVWNCFQYKIAYREKKHGERHWKSKVSDAVVEEIKLLAAGGTKQIDIAKKFDLSKACICNILKGKRRQTLARSPRL
jgi:hypothetical protein